VSASLQLVADIGGTHARFALHDPATHALSAQRTIAAAAHPDIASAIRGYLGSVSVSDVTAVCFAVAGPASSDLIEFTNSPWKFSRSALERELGFRRLRVVNDFTALALGIPHVEPQDLHCLRPGVADPHAPKAVLGPGTGLGVSGLIPCQVADGGMKWIALSGEGGHVGFAPTGEIEIALLRFLTRERDRASVERVLCGEGLTNLYEFLAEHAGQPRRRPAPAEITDMAVGQRDPLAQQAVELFCAILGSVAGDLALTLGARGGVYIGGGIAPRILQALSTSRFVERFLAKGRLAKMLEPVPVQVILDPVAALRGAAAMLQES
jgi:glucokinase